MTSEIQQKQVQFANKNESPILKIETQKMHLALAKKTSEISTLKKQLTEKVKYISSIEAQLFAIKKLYSDTSKVKQQLETAKDKIEQLEKENNKLKKQLIEQHKEFTEEKRIEAKKHLTDISKLKVTIDTYIQKNLRANMNELDNEKLNIQLGLLKQTNDFLSKKSEQDIIHKEIQNKIKFSRFKEKMIDNINNTREEVTELNMKYMDVSTKLTMLQNHQLLIQLDYQSQQLEENKIKIQMLEKRISDLNKDLEVHKEVEVSFAEKTKKLIDELKKYKNKENQDIKISEENITSNNNNNINNNKSFGESNNQQSSNISVLSSNITNNNKIINNDYQRIINLEKKVINLEKKLEEKKKEYNDLKEKYDDLENILKTQDRKYSGLYHFLEESLNNFFLDENILNNKEIYISNESLKKFQFLNLTKQEKYTTLIILMKYLMPLVYGEQDINNKINNSYTENYKMKYFIPKANRLIINDKFRNIIKKKQRSRNVSNDNVKINLFKGRNSSETLPSIIRSSSLRKYITKSPTTGSAISSSSVNITKN